MFSFIGPIRVLNVGSYYFLFSQGMGILRAACIFVSFGGVLVITWVDNGQTLTTMHGDYVVVITAFLYSLYVTLLKYLVPPNKVS